MNIFLSFFRRSKIDQSLAARIEELEAKSRMQGCENRLSYERINALSSKMTALQKEVALLNGKVNKLRESNRRLTVRALRIEINRDGRLPQIDSAELAKTVRDSAHAYMSTYTPAQVDQRRYTVADYFSNHLPHWAAEHVTQQRLVARVNAIAEENSIEPLTVKTKARTMARVWPVWLLERAASFITLDKGGIAPVPAKLFHQAQQQFGGK